MAPSAELNALGLMSGTSGDGIDAALLRTDGLEVVAFGPSLTVPYAPEFRDRLFSVLGGKGPVAEVEFELTRLHAHAVKRLLEAASGPAVDVLGFHGHTILHDPAARRSWQIGDGALLARLTGIPTVGDFRGADVAAGGQGAPLVPVFHAALAAGLARPVAVLNLGGVANVTWIGAAGELLAFDTGPGNALIDDWVRRHTGAACDEDGRLAAAGRVDADTLARLLDHPYFGQRPPKSLDRNAMASDRVNGLSLADGAATLAAFTVAAVARARAHFPSPVTRWLVTGGGRRNPVVMRGLAMALGVPVEPVEAVGWNGDALEAQAFAYLAVRSLKGLPLTFPTTTGVATPQPGGRRHDPKR